MCHLLKSPSHKYIKESIYRWVLETIDTLASRRSSGRSRIHGTGRFTRATVVGMIITRVIMMRRWTSWLRGHTDSSRGGGHSLMGHATGAGHRAVMILLTVMMMMRGRRRAAVRSRCARCWWRQWRWWRMHVVVVMVRCSAARRCRSRCCWIRTYTAAVIIYHCYTAHSVGPTVRHVVYDSTTCATSSAAACTSLSGIH